MNILIVITVIIGAILLGLILRLRNKKNKYPYNIQDIKIKNVKKIKFVVDSKKYLFKETYIDTSIDSNIEAIQNLFSEIPSNMKIFFFDHFHPEISDPGAYVMVQKLDDGKFAYKLNNHGWSSSWQASTLERVSRYLKKNWKYNEDILRIEGLSKKEIDDEKHIENEYILNENRLNLIHDANNYSLFEFNGSHLIKKQNTYIFLNEDQELIYNKTSEKFNKNDILNIVNIMSLQKNVDLLLLKE